VAVPGDELLIVEVNLVAMTEASSEGCRMGDFEDNLSEASPTERGLSFHTTFLSNHVSMIHWMESASGYLYYAPQKFSRPSSPPHLKSGISSSKKLSNNPYVVMPDFRKNTGTQVEGSLIFLWLLQAMQGKIWLVRAEMSSTLPYGLLCLISYCRFGRTYSCPVLDEEVVMAVAVGSNPLRKAAFTRRINCMSGHL
jgi:hypothetical protein